MRFDTRGRVVTCPTTGRDYRPAGEWEFDGDYYYIQSKCPYCDATGRVECQWGYRKDLPQVHIHILRQR